MPGYFSKEARANRKSAREQAAKERRAKSDALIARAKEQWNAADQRYADNMAAIEAARNANLDSLKAALDANTQQFKDRIAAVKE